VHCAKLDPNDVEVLERAEGFDRSSCRGKAAAPERQSDDEYLACTLASVESSAEFFGDLTCKTDLTTVSDLPTPTVCVGPYQRCPALNSSSEDGDS